MSAKSAKSSGSFGEFDWGLAEDLVEHLIEHFAESLAEDLVKHYRCSSRPTENHRWFSRSEWFADWSLTHLKRPMRSLRARFHFCSHRTETVSSLAEPSGWSDRPSFSCTSLFFQLSFRLSFALSFLKSACLTAYSPAGQPVAKSLSIPSSQTNCCFSSILFVAMSATQSKASSRLLKNLIRLAHKKRFRH